MAGQAIEDKDLPYRIVVSEDKMQVKLEWLGKESSPQHGNEILAYLQKSGIVEGVQKEALDRFLVSKKSEAGIVIARGTAPRPGIDGSWEAFFDLSPKKSPERLLDGSVDFHHLRAFLEVREGQPLARRIPAIPGIQGKDCFGKPVPPPAPKEPSWALGPGTAFEPEHPDYVIATVRGVLEMRDGMLGVATQIAVRGSVDFHTGDIDVSVPITISEDVKPGFSVRSKSHIVVGGCIQSSRVECGGDLKVGGGILGEPFPAIKVGGNLKAHYTQNARIEVGGDCSINKVVKDSVLSCGGTLSVGDRLVSSEAFAGSGAQIGTLGAESDHTTQISLGFQPGTQRKLFRIHAELWEISASLHQSAHEHAEARQSLALEQRFDGSGGAQKVGGFSSAGSAEMRRGAAQVNDLQARQAALRKRLNDLQAGLASETVAAKLQIEKSAFEGSEILMGSRRWKLAADLPGRRTIRQETLQRAPISILAIGDATFQKEMGAWASAAELWGMRVQGPGEALSALLESARPDFVLLQGRGMEEAALSSLAASVGDARHAKTLFLLFPEGLEEKALEQMPKAANFLLIPNREEVLRVVDSSPRA